MESSILERSQMIQYRRLTGHANHGTFYDEQNRVVAGG